MSQSAPDASAPHTEDGSEVDSLGALPHTRAITRWERWWRPFWALPLFIVVVATLTGLLLPLLDSAIGDRLPYVFPGGPDGARSILGTIAGAMISVTGLVFSITMVVIQLASSQFTPRVLGDFLTNRITQTTLGIFTASFTYALAVLRSVRGQSGQTGAFVPQISVTVAFLLVLASVGMFLAFIHHTTSSIQVGAIVSRLGETTRTVIQRYFPEGADTVVVRADELAWSTPTGPPRLELAVDVHGHIVEIDHRSLVAWAEENDCVVELLHPVGAFVVEGSPAIRIWGGSASQDEAEPVRRSVVVEQDRSHHQDPAFGIRKLVDIAERALSPGINDPTTAVQVLDELHRVCRTLVQRFDLPRVVSHDGVVRLVHRPQEVEDLMDLSVEEVLHYGHDSLQVPRRVLAMVEDLRPVTRPEYVDHLDRWERVARETLAGSKRGTPGA